MPFNLWLQSAIAGEKKMRFGQPFMQFSKYIDEEYVILGFGETAHMADQRGAGRHLQLFAQVGAAGGVGIVREADRIGKRLNTAVCPACGAEQRFAGLPGTTKKVRGRPPNQVTHVLPVGLAVQGEASCRHGAVTMRNPHTNALSPARPQDHAAEEMHVTVHRGERAEHAERSPKCIGVGSRPCLGWSGVVEDPSAKSFNLRVKVAAVLGLHRKVELDLGPIDLAVQVHYERFRAAPVHPAENVKNPFRAPHTGLPGTQFPRGPVGTPAVW